MTARAKLLPDILSPISLGEFMDIDLINYISLAN